MRLSRAGDATHDVEEQVPASARPPGPPPRCRPVGVLNISRYRCGRLRPMAISASRPDRRHSRPNLSLAAKHFERVTQFAQPVGGQLGKQRFLVGEVAIRRRTRHATTGSHLAQRHRFGAAEVQQRPRRIDQRTGGWLPRSRIASSPAEHKPGLGLTPSTQLLSLSGRCQLKLLTETVMTVSSRPQ